MPNVRELLEREGATVDLQHGHFERMLRRRDRKRRTQRMAAGVLAIGIALVTFLAMRHAFDTAERPANETNLRTFAGMVIRYTGDPYSPGGNLVAQDPSTGEVTTVIEGAKTESLRKHGVAWAAVSADGRWVAFQLLSTCSDSPGALWVTNGTDEPRQLTTGCLEIPAMAEGNWIWAPTGSQLAVVEGDQLILIDAATGVRTVLRNTTGEVTSVAWSPDGSRIAYGAVAYGAAPVGSTGAPNRVPASVYSVDVHSTDQALLGNVIGMVRGDGQASGIRWSPDGRRIAVVAGGASARLYLLKLDGSGAELLREDVHFEHTLGWPSLDWSPDGTRIAYATLIRDRDRLQIWNGSPDGSIPVLVFDPTSSPGEGTSSGTPVWSPDGTQIAFRYDPAGGEKGWLVGNADGTGAVHEIDELQYLSWRGGWYFCDCYG